MDRNTNEDQSWKQLEFNGKIVDRKDICTRLDRVFRCGHTTTGSPLEYYGRIPRILESHEVDEIHRKFRKKREKE